MNNFKNKRIVFHGTDKNFTKFSDDAIGQGGDPNSCLGVFFAEDPGHAAQYARLDELNGLEGLIVIAVINDIKPFIEDLEHQVVLIPEAIEKYKKDCLENSALPLELEQLDFFQTKDDYKICAYFAREHYLEKGHDNLQYCEVNTDTPICVALQTKDIEVLRTITIEQAEKLSQEFYEFSDFYDQEKRFDAITKLIDIKPMVNSLKNKH